MTDRLLWRVVPSSHSHGGVGESEGWSKHHPYILSSFLLHAGAYLLSSEIPQTSRRPLRVQRWPTAALICRLCLKRSGTSWRSWIWSYPKVRSPQSGFDSWTCSIKRHRVSTADVKHVYLKPQTGVLCQMGECQCCCRRSEHDYSTTNHKNTDLLSSYFSVNSPCCCCYTYMCLSYCMHKPHLFSSILLFWWTLSACMSCTALLIRTDI